MAHEELNYSRLKTVFTTAKFESDKVTVQCIYYI